MRVCAFFLASLALGLPSFGQTPTMTPIAYTLRFPSPQTHYVDVEAVIPTDGHAPLELMMAVWTPGSYLVREYPRHLERLRATSLAGEPLTMASTRKNRWQVNSAELPAVRLNYRVYGRQMSVRTNWIDTDFALLNGAATFVTLADNAGRPHDVTIELPPGWRQSASALPAHPERGAESYRAPDFDTLVDSPIVAGNPTIREFVVEGVPHALVNIGNVRDVGMWDATKAAADVERIVRQQQQFWGRFPYPRYLFLNVIAEAGGGIEHRDSTVLMTSRWQMRDRARYLDWLTLVSHELFHAWNGKRLRPIELGPFDYEREVHTRSLWVTEGLTVYYGALLVHRAGLSSRDEYLAELSNDIRTLQTTPGRLEQSVEQASFDAWTKYYRPDENSRNTTVSYYTKGAVIGFLLDARLRRLSGGARSLDDVMRLAYDRYSGDRGFTPTDFRNIVKRPTTSTAGGDADDAWLRVALETTSELDYREAQSWYGLDLPATSDSSVTEPMPEESLETGWIGLDTRISGNSVVVARIPRDTPAADAGFNVGDEILAFDDYRVYAADWTERQALYAAGATASVLVSRRGRLARLDMTFGRAPGPAWDVTTRSVLTAAQPYRIDAWLGAIK